MERRLFVEDVDRTSLSTQLTAGLVQSLEVGVVGVIEAVATILAPAEKQSEAFFAACVFSARYSPLRVSPRWK